MKKKTAFIFLLMTTIALMGCQNKNNSSSEDDTSKLEGNIKERLDQIDRIISYKSTNSSSKKFNKVFQIEFEQYIDHNNHDLGTFSQKVELGYKSLTAPNVYVSSGYMTSNNNSYYEDGENEIAFLLECNYIFVEHRYFGNSLPVEIDYDDNTCWQYLTTEQAAADAHDIVTQLKRALEGKWLSTGMSKGGMTTEMYAYYYPGDMDLYIPYVAPFCNSFSDKRMMKFIYEEAGDLQYGEEKASTIRNEVLTFQVKMLEYRDDLAPIYFQDGIDANVQYSEYATQDLLYDAAVLEFGIGFWQYYQTYTSLEKCLKMTEGTEAKLEAKKEAFYDYFTTICSPDDCSVNNKYTPYYIQAYQELGNYGYDFSYIRNALTEDAKLVVSEEEESTLMEKLVLNEKQLALEQKDLMYSKINSMLSTTEDEFIIIYGSSDPWYAVRPDDVSGRNNINIYVNDNHPHTTNIANFDKEVSEEILNKIKTIMGVED